jgi:PhnB protein
MPQRTVPVPKGYRTVTSQLVVRGADAAAAYYTAVFDAAVLSRIASADGIAVQQIELKIGNSILRLMDEMPDFGIWSPLAFGGTSIGLHIYRRDVDEICARALEHGAGLLVPLADMPWGERYMKFVDPFGHVWSVSRRIDVTRDNTRTDVATADTFSVHEPRANQVTPTLEQVIVQQGQETAA